MMPFRAPPTATLPPALRATAALPSLAEVAQKREDLEGEKRARLASGVLGLDRYGMRDPLAKAGLKYID